MKAPQKWDQIWANTPRNQCKSDVRKAYQLDFHKPIYIACKLANTFPMYNKNPL